CMYWNVVVLVCPLKRHLQSVPSASEFTLARKVLLPVAHDEPVLAESGTTESLPYVMDIPLTGILSISSRLSKKPSRREFLPLLSTMARLTSRAASRYAVPIASPMNSTTLRRVPSEGSWKARTSMSRLSVTDVPSAVIEAVSFTVPGVSKDCRL